MTGAGLVWLPDEVDQLGPAWEQITAAQAAAHHSQGREYR